jgi:PIN domain nuclease of toxin-antitoxin system
MNEASASLLLDTNALIFLAAGTLPKASVEAFLRASSAGPVLISPISAWEIGALAQRGGRGADRPRACWTCRS